MSQTQRQAANEWYDHTLYSRLNDKLSGAIVLIMHRLHEDDLAGHVLTQEPWEVVRIPAIAEEDEVHRVETVFGRQSFRRKAGEVLHPEREPLEMLEQIRRTLGEYNFAGQYQQAPSPQGGGMVKAAWFRRYAPNERPEEFDRVVQSWDTANKATELSDFSVCTSWGIKGKDLYLLHVLRKRMEYPELKRAVCEQCEAFNASVVLIEDKASGTQLIQELIDYGLHAVTRYQPQSRQDHAHARADRDDRERLCASAQGGGVAPRISARADGVSQRQARRPGRLRPHRCSTGSSEPAAAPPPMPGSGICIKSSPKGRTRRGASRSRSWRSGWASSGGERAATRRHGRGLGSRCPAAVTRGVAQGGRRKLAVIASHQSTHDCRFPLDGHCLVLQVCSRNENRRRLLTFEGRGWPVRFIPTRT